MASSFPGQSQAPQTREVPSTDRPGLAYHVLIVDDEPDITQSLQGLLERALPQVRVHIAADGPAGLEALDRQRMDLVVADYRMPAMNGIEFLRRAEQKRPGMPRILITAYGDLRLAVEAINEADIDRFYTKPVKGQEVIEAVRGLLLQRRDRHAWSQEFMESMASLRKRSSFEE